MHEMLKTRLIKTLANCDGLKDDSLEETGSYSDAVS